LSDRKTRPVAATIALLVATFLSSLDVTVVGVAMPRITGQLGGLELYPWVFSLYLLTSTSTVPIWGKLADLYGRKRTLHVGLAIFLAGSLACGAAPSMRILVLARGLQGLGAGAIFPIVQTIFGDLFSVERRARMQALFSLVWGASAILGPLAGGAILSVATWPWVFYVNLPIGLVTMVLLESALHETFERRPVDLDVGGAALLSLVITLALLGLGAVGRAPRNAALLLGGAAITGVAFVLLERRRERARRDALMAPSLFRDGVVALAGVTGLLMGQVLFAFIAYAPLFLQGVIGMSPLAGGLVTAPMSFAWSLATFVGGRILLRSGYRALVRGGAIALAVGTLAVWQSVLRLPSTFGWVLFSVAMILYGGGMGVSLSAYLIATQDRVTWERRGTATAVIALSRQLGGMLGLAALGALSTGLLGQRLASAFPDGGAPSPSELLDPHTIAMLAPATLDRARGALHDALAAVFLCTTVVGLVVVGVSLLFPDVKAKTARQPSEATAPLAE
jgi:EmrB/QacA subfamily drug resistance transporter